MREQRELRAELRDLFARAQLPATLFGAGAGLVEPRIQFGDGLDDFRALGGVIDLQGRHQFGQQIQIGGEFGQALLRFAQRGHGGGLLRSGVQFGQARFQRCQRGRVGKVIAGSRADAFVRGDQFGFHRVDRGDIDVAQFPDRQQMPALGRNILQRANVILHLLEAVRVQPRQQRALFGRGLAHRALGLCADAFDLLVFVQHRLAGGGDLVQQRRETAGVGVGDPVVGVEHAARGLHQQGVALHRHRIGIDLAGQRQQFGNAAHQFGIADLAEKTAGRRLPRGVFLETERRQPDLHRMDAGRLVALVEDHHAAVFQPRVAMRQQRRLQRAFDQVVGEQRVAAGDRLVEHVQHVLAIGRADRALEAHAVEGAVELVGVAVLQQIAAGPDDAVVFGQLDAGLADAVDALHLLRQRVVGQMPPLFLAVGQHAQQHQTADLGELDLRIVERLRLVLHRLSVDAQAILGVVLDLDGQIAADGFDEHGVEDVDMRMTAVDHHLARRWLPLEIVGRRQRDIALATVVDVAHLALRRNAPAEHADIAQPLADLERGQQFAVAHQQLQQAGVLVIGVQLAEILREAVDGEEAAGDVGRGHVVAVRRFHQPVQREHVLDPGFLLQPDEDVVTEHQQIADAHDVARHAIVLGPHPQPPDHFQRAGTELLQPLRIQCIRQPAQARALIGQARAQHLVSAAFGNGLVDGGGVGGIGHIFGFLQLVCNFLAVQRDFFGCRE